MDPVILDLTGVEIEIRAFRGVNNTFRATFTNELGDPDSLVDYNVLFLVVDRPGGTVKLDQTKTPAEHEDAAGGVTLLTAAATVFAGLTGQRDYTWKYLVAMEHVVTGAKQVRFHGDLRVVAPVTPV